MTLSVWLDSETASNGEEQVSKSQRYLHLEVKRNVCRNRRGAQNLSSMELLQELQGKEEGSARPAGATRLFWMCAALWVSH